MKYGSVCSGIEAATVAWHPLRWKPAWFSEIEKFPSHVLDHHYPNVPNLGDMTKLKRRKEFNESAIELLVGGTPCQSFSVAGLRKGMDDPRGNLALVFLEILNAKRPRWVVWENVPGVLSSNKGRDFGSFLGGLAKLGYGWAYRVLDAQYFGVPQRRRRVFVVGYFRDWRPAAAVLFERSCLSGDSAPSRKKRERIAGTVAARFGSSRNNPEELAPITIDRAAFNQGQNALYDPEINQNGVMPSLVARGPHAVAHEAYGIPGNWIGRKPENGGNAVEPMKDISPNLTSADRHAVAFQASEMRLTGKITLKDNVPTLKAETKKGDTESLVLYENHANDSRITEVDQAPTLSSRAGTGGNNLPLAQKGSLVRRLTPRECERLQGFPDDYTLLPPKKQQSTPDGLRYKALGNSMAVPVMNWIGKRIEEVEHDIHRKNKN